MAAGFDNRFPKRGSALPKRLAANVRRLRVAKGWTQGELAAAMKLDQPAISVLENSRANPTLLFLEHLADALGVRFEELFAEKVDASRATKRGAAASERKKRKRPS